MAAGEHRLGVGTAPATPPTGYVALYAKTDKKLYAKDDAGLETPLGVGSAIGPSKAIFVDPVSGNDGTGARGDASKPFLTIAAAVAATGISAGDVILLLPGTHALAATVPEPAVSSVAVVGFGRDVTRVEFNSGGGSLPFLSIGATVVDGFRMSNLTLATGTGDIPLEADGGTNGAFMYQGLVLEDVYFATLTSSPTVGPQLRFCARLDINNVVIDGSLSLDTCAALPTLTLPLSRVTNLTVRSSTTLKWDDDLAVAGVPAMARGTLVIRDSYLGQIFLDEQPNVLLQNCRYSGLTSANPLGDSASGAAAIYQEQFCAKEIGGTINFQGPQALLDSVVSPAFSFRDPVWEGPFGAAFARVAEVNGRTVVVITNLDGPGNFGPIQAGLGIDARVFGATFSPNLVIVPASGGTITPGKRTFTTGALAAGNNVIPFPWGAAFAAPLHVHVTPFSTYDDLVVAGYTATDVTINAAAGGGLATITLFWSVG